MKKNIIIKIIALISIVANVYLISSWIPLLLSSGKFNEYLSDMNKSNIIFSPATLSVDIVGILIISLFCIVGSLLMLNQKDIGRKLFLYSFFALPIYNACWIIVNLLLNRSVSLFFINTILFSLICLMLYWYFNKPHVKELFEEKANKINTADR